VAIPEEIQRIITRRNRRRLVFAGIVLAFYASFLLQYIGLVDFFAGGSSLLGRSTLYFCLLIVGFVILEYLYLRARRREDGEDRLRRDLP